MNRREFLRGAVSVAAAVVVAPALAAPAQPETFIDCDFGAGDETVAWKVWYGPDGKMHGEPISFREFYAMPDAAMAS